MARPIPTVASEFRRRFQTERKPLAKCCRAVSLQLILLLVPSENMVRFTGSAIEHHMILEEIQIAVCKKVWKIDGASGACYYESNHRLT